MTARGGNLKIIGTTFDYNYFQLGLINNCYFDYSFTYNKFRMNDNLDYHGGYTCKDSSQNLHQGDCQSLNIENSVFTNYNPMAVILKFTYDYSSQPLTPQVDGSIINFRQFLGPIFIKGSRFRLVVIK